MKNQLPLALLFTLGGIFAAMGALLLYVALLKPMQLTWKSSSWIETPATVAECRLENRSRGAMTIVINYHYYYNKIKYCGNRYDFFRSNGNATSWRIDNMREIVRSLPPGTRTTCLVDPQKPSEAVISRKIFLSPVALLLPVLFLSIGVGMLLAAIKRLLKKPTRKIIKKLLRKNRTCEQKIHLPDHAYSPDLSKYRQKRNNQLTVLLVLFWATGAFIYNYWQIHFDIIFLTFSCGSVGLYVLWQMYFQHCPRCGKKLQCLKIEEDASHGFCIYHCPECKIKSQKEHYSDGNFS